MGEEKIILCGRATGGDAQAIRLSLAGEDPNVTLKLSGLCKRMVGDPSEEFLDLLEIATYVYCADQAVSRGGAGVVDAGAKWRRQLRFRIPVRNLDLWRSEEALSALTSTLGFLSDDKYTFEFEALPGGRSIRHYLDLEPDKSVERIEEVVLFSGGLDSLGGAVQEAVVDRRRIALVTHRPSYKLARRYSQLKQMIDAAALFSPLFVPVVINKKKGLGREPSQRSRSFLYVTLGATVARMLGLTRVRFYENGVVSLNLPISEQVVGAKATRTTHPRVLRGFSELLTIVSRRRFDVENPFLWKTKAEVVEGIVQAACGDTIKYSTSCQHTWEMTKLHPHCGSCSQCIDRRFAVLAAGASELDPAEGYKTDLLVGEREEGESRTMISSYVETANRIAKQTPYEFLSRFGEVSRAVRWLDVPADAGAQLVFDLYKRHAVGVTNVVDRGLGDYASQIRERTLPHSCLLRLVYASGGSSQASSERGGLPDFAFIKSGQAWRVRYDGGEEFMLLPSKGVSYLKALLDKQGTPIPVVKLAALVAVGPVEFAPGGADEGPDEEAMEAYEVHARDLQENLDRARAMSDEAEADRARAELAEFTTMVGAEVGSHRRGKGREGDRSRVRKRVQAALRRAIQQIAQYDPGLAEHLRSPNLTCGWSPCYDPKEPVNWVLSGGAT